MHIRGPDERPNTVILLFHAHGIRATLWMDVSLNNK